MLYDLSQPHFTGAPQFPGQPPNAIRYQQLQPVDGATVERAELITHSGSHVDAPFHYLPSLPCISELPLSHFYGPCIAIDLRGLPPSHGINAADLRPHEPLITPGIILLLKTGWGEKRANTKEFLAEWPWMSGDGAQYLLDRKIKGMVTEGLSTGGYPSPSAESDAHRLLLGSNCLLVEDTFIPDQLLDGKRRFFMAVPILIANAGGAWARPVVWDAGDLEAEQPPPQVGPHIPPSIVAQIATVRGTA